MARVAIEVATRTVTEITVRERITQAADGRLVVADHPDAVKLATSADKTFTLDAAIAAGLVEVVGGEGLGCEVEAAPVAEEEE